MRMPPFNLHNPSTLEDALTKASELESSGEEFDWISGGTDLIPMSLEQTKLGRWSLFKNWSSLVLFTL